MNSQEKNDLLKQLYEAASLNDLDRLKNLLENEKEVDILLDALSEVCIELQLNCVHLSDEIKLTLDRKLLHLRFFHQQTKIYLSSQEICDRVKFTIKLTRNLHIKEGEEELLIVDLIFIAKQIFTLKKLLKSTYGRLPWEEIEFCVLNFIRTFKEQNEIVLFSRAILTKSNIINYLTIFGNHLESLLEHVMTVKPQELARLPNLKRDEVVDEIMELHPEYKPLYDDHERIRDIHSLNIMLNYIELVESIKLEEKHGILILMRALQVIGEHLKNTLESPKLSQTTISFLLTSLSGSTRDIVIKLRNSLSHIQSLSKRDELLENLECDYLKGIRNDIKKIGGKIGYILSKYKIRILRELGDKFVKTDDEEVMKEVANVMKNFDSSKISERHASELKNNDVTRLKQLIGQFRSKINLKSGYGEFLFATIDYTLKECPEQKPFDYTNALAPFRGLYDKFSIFINDTTQHKLNFIRVMKFAMSQLLGNLSPQIEPSKLKIVLEMIISINGLITEEHENPEVAALFFKIIHIAKFEVTGAIWTEKFGRKLRRKESEECIVSGKVDEVSKKQKDDKLAQLRNVFKGIKYSEFKENKKLQAVVEVLLLDLIPMLRYPNLRSRLFFLDENYPTIMGVDLRNHLAHNNVIVEVLLDPTEAIYLFVEKLLEFEKNQNFNLKDLAYLNIPELENVYSHSIDVLNKKRKMFKALKENNYEAFCECLNQEADIRSRDLDYSTCLHFAMNKPDTLKITKYLQKQGLSSKLKNLDGQTALHIAALKNNLQLVIYLLNNFDFDINDADFFGRTPSHLAAWSGNEHLLNLFYTRGADLTKKDKMLYTPLLYAVMSRKTSVVEMFFKVDLFDKLNECFGGYTALHIAADFGSSKVVEYLLSRKVKVDARQDIGATPLHLAALNGHLEVVKTLIRYGADVNSRNINGNGPMHWACETNRPELVKVLIKHGADVNITDHDRNFAPIHFVAKGGFIEILELFLEHNANVNIATNSGLTPLYYAVQGRQLKVVEILLKQKDIKVNYADVAGLTPLHLAASSGDAEIVKLLIKNGAEVNFLNLLGFNPLHMAAKNGHKEVVDLLIANKVSVHARTIGENLLPLHFAAESGNENIIKKLIVEGSNVNATTADGSNCLHIAIRNGADIIDFLLKQGIKTGVNTKRHKYSPLHEAVLIGNLKAVETLLRAGIDINAQDYLGNTSIHLAIEKESSEIFVFLLQNGVDITLENDMGDTPFHTAVKRNMFKFIQMCMSSGLVDDKLISASIEIAVCQSDIHIVKLLLEQADLNLKEYRDSKGNSLLHLAALFGRVDSVELLLNYDFEVNLKNESGQTPLLLAAIKGCEEIVEILLKNGAEINVQDSDGATALHEVSLHNHLKCAKILFEHGADDKITNNKYMLAIEHAVAAGYLDLIKLFLKTDRDYLNRKGAQGYTILYIASQYGRLEVVKYLLKEGADMYAETEGETLPIHMAARLGFTNIIQLFLDKGMDVNVRGKSNFSLLHFAASKGSVKAIKYLIERGCDINSVGEAEMTPLLIALLQGFEDFVKCLLDNGVIYNLKNSTSELIEHCPTDSLKELISSVAKLFSFIGNGKIIDVEDSIKKGVPLNCLHKAKGSPLHFAVYKGNVEIVEILLRNKVWINTPHNGWTPLHYAVKYSHNKIVFLLLWHGARYDIESNNGRKPIAFTENATIRNLFQLINDSFQGIQNDNSNIVSRLKKIKDKDIVKAVVRAEDKHGNTLITAAIKNKFRRIKELEQLFQNKFHAQNKRADMLLGDEKYKEANEIYMSIYEQRKEIFGEDNPATLDIKSKYSAVLYKQQLYQQALDSMEDTYERLKRVLGVENERTLRERSSMALVLHRQGKCRKSLEISEEVHRIQKNLLPPDHEDCLNTMKNMALTMMSLNMYDKALEIYQAALEIDLKKYGHLHQYTLVAKNNIALILSQQSKYNEALALFEDVYEGRKALFGRFHSDTLRALHNRIMILKEQEKYEEALEAYDKLLKCQREHLGSRHLDTLNTQFHMADLFMRQTKYLAAFKIMKNIKDHKIAIEGPNHVDVRLLNMRMEAILDQYRKIGINSNLDSFLSKLVSTMNNAAKNGDIDTIKNLVKSGVEVGEKDKEGRSSIHYAIDGNQMEAFKVLLDHNADILDKTHKGNTVLHTACNKGYQEFVELILSDLNSKKLAYLLNAATNVGKMTALHVAASHGYLEIVQILLKKGAIYNCTNKVGEKPKDLTENKEIKDLLQLIEDLFESVKWGDRSILPKLYRAEKNHFLCVMNAKDLNHSTLLKLLISRGETEVARDLTKKFLQMKI